MSLKSIMPRLSRRKHRVGRAETKGAGSGIRIFTEASTTWLRQAARCDKPLTSLLRRRERSASQNVVGQWAVWVSEQALGQDVRLTHPVTTVSSWRFAIVYSRLTHFSSGAACSWAVLASCWSASGPRGPASGPRLDLHVDYRLSTAACRLVDVSRSAHLVERAVRAKWTGCMGILHVRE